MIDSRRQIIRRGLVVHFADYAKWLREALLAARRGPAVHRNTMYHATSNKFRRVTSIDRPFIL